LVRAGMFELTGCSLQSRSFPILLCFCVYCCRHSRLATLLCKLKNVLSNETLPISLTDKSNHIILTSGNIADVNVNKVGFLVANLNVS
jgi:hypothetical protein